MSKRRNKSSKKRITWMLSLCLFLSCNAFLSGCTGSQVSDAGSTENKIEDTKQENQNADKDQSIYQEDYAVPLPKDYEGTLSMWGWDNRYFETVAEGFQKEYPNVTFQYTPVENGDLLQKYETALLTGESLPDIGWALMAYRAKIFELDMWEPLNAAPYNFDINDVFACVRPQMTNQAGDVCGIEQSLSAAGLAYRRDLAKEYLGTDDPKELETMLPTWDAFCEKGAEVYEKSGGTVYMWPGLADAGSFIREQQTLPWIEGNVVNVTETLQHSIDVSCQFRDTNTSDTLEAWTTGWYEALGEGRHIFTGCATWSVAFEIETYDPEGKDSGHWGLMNAPEGNIMWGGTTIGISKTCQDKRLAWEFVKYAALSTEGAEAINSIGLMTTAIQPYQDNDALRSYYSPWFGNQNLGEYFLDEIVPNVMVRKMTVDDHEIHESLNLLMASLGKDREMTAEKAAEYLKEDLSERLPGYKIE